MIKNLLLVVLSIMLITTVYSGYLYYSDDEETEKTEEYYPPVITITAPQHNEKVGGIVELAIFLTPDRPGVQIGYYLDDVLLEFSYDRTYDWDTSALENGRHLLMVTAKEFGSHVPADIQPSSMSIRVSVYNAPYIPPEENTPPEITLETPLGTIDGVYRGPITIRGEVEDIQSKPDTIEMMIDSEEWFDVPVSREKWQFTLNPESFTGDIMVEVRAFDGEEYSEIKSIVLSCDNSPPEIDISNPKESESVAGIVSLKAEVEDDNDIEYISFSVDGIELQKSTANSCELNTTEYTNGIHELTVVSADILGNTDSRSVGFEIHNNHAPFADISYPLDGAEYQEEDTIPFDGSDSRDPDDDSLSYRWESDIDGYLSDAMIFETVLSPGSHSVTLTVTDTHHDTSVASILLTVHEHVNQYPEVTISEPEEDALLKGEITVRGTAGDPDGEVSALSYRLDEGNWTDIAVGEEWSFVLDTASLEDGDHTLDVLVTDDEDASSMDHISFTTDNTGPAVKIISPTNVYVRGVVYIEVDVHDHGSDIESIEFRIKNESVQSGTDTKYRWDTSKEEDGPEYAIEVIVTDSAGNRDNDSLVVLVDNTPPEIKEMDPPSGSWVSRNITLEPSLYDEQSGVDRVVFGIDGEEQQNSTSRVYHWSTTDISDGEHTTDITAYDKAGNSVKGGFTYLVDNTKPTVMITNPEEGEKINGPGKIQASAVDVDEGSGVDTVRFFFNGLIQLTDSEEPYEFDFHSDDYADGDYTITVIARDRAGNSAHRSLDIKLGDVAEAIISEPMTNYLSPYDVNGKERLIFEDYRAVPMVASKVKNGGVMPSVNWDGSENPKNSLSISMPVTTGYAGYAGNIAISYWTNPEKAIVVDSYEHAVMMTAYASIMDYPIVIYDNSNPTISDEALWKMGTIYANQIIVLGNTPYNDDGVTVFTEADLLNEQIGAAQFMGITLDYITVVNPNDIPSRSNTAYLSSFAGVFASHHDGLIVACEASSSEMNTKIHNAIDVMEDAGMPVKHICIVGDHISLPMAKDGNTPGDNTYADLDGNKYTIEISIGRVLAKELKDISYYVDRIVNYEDYLAIQFGTPPLRMLDPLNWNNNAMIYMGWLAEFAEDSENHCREYMWAMGRFNTQDDTDKAHAGLGTTVMMQDLAMSNYFIINADHGQPTGTMSWGSEHLPEMHPGITFGVSCSLGRIDGVNKQASVTYTMMEKGMNVYLAPTRTAYGSFVQTYPYQPVAAPGLCYLYLRYIIDNDYDSGTAYMHAKNDLIENSWAGNVDKTTTWQYQHFGDPGFNPYEPCNEGSLF